MFFFCAAQPGASLSPAGLLQGGQLVDLNQAAAEGPVPSVSGHSEAFVVEMLMAEKKVHFILCADKFLSYSMEGV